MLSPQKAGALQAYLGGLPPNLAWRLARAVEVERLTDGARLPHDVILEGLRPVLRGNERFDRTPTPQRLFCSPFEDLLISLARSEKKKGRIARASIMPVWNWLTGELLPEASRRYIDDSKAMLAATEADKARARAIAFCGVAAAAMRKALATKEGRAAARKALGGDDTVEDAAEMALLLRVAGDILELRDVLAKPTPSFTPDLVRAARSIYERVRAAEPDAAPLVIVVAMNRLARRWEGLRLAASIAGRKEDTLISTTDIGLAGDILLEEIEALARTVCGARHPSFDADKLADTVACFAELSTGLIKELEIRRDGRWGRSLFKDRGEIAEAMNGFMARALREISAALPTQKIARAADSDRIDRALRYAALIAGCKPFAAAASFAASLKAAETEAIAHLHHFVDDALVDLRTTESQPVLDRFALAVELTAVLCGEEEASLLRRQGQAARRVA